MCCPPKRGNSTTAAQFPAWDGREVVYLTTCFGLVTRLPLSQLSGLETLDPRSGQNRRFGPYRFSVFFNGRFSFSPNGSRGVIDSGGLYSQLEWLAPHGVVPIRLGLAVVNAPSWSPDGKLIMFGGVPPHAGVDVATLPTDLYTIDPRAPRQLHLVIGGLTDFRPSGAGWMRNSKWVVIGMQPPGQPSGLWIIDVTNGHKALLVAGTEFGRATVSPTGRSVAVGVGVDAEIDPALNVKPPRVGIDIIPLPPQELLSKMLH